ncbi:hypothetical protein HWV23_12125 [Natronomonas halophila]|uniref:hypothetical protein n=1 Tax=Natronomonas halophila TaxID=2747817 RepID=UPI0015B459A8|nr:hypothetical protein [Natronomonas halophila]QLD86441.1 hypothetical protein HWV23_12125 [Natronomonas halophila]
MGIGNPIGRQVLDLVDQWIPSAVHGHEREYQSELQDYLDEALNQQSGGLGLSAGGGSHVVSTERGTSYGDVVVDDEVGIELKRDFTNSQKKKLRGQLEDYADNYDYVIACACGIEDMDGWRELENKFIDSNRGMMDMTQFAFVIKRREDMGKNPDSRGNGGGLFGGDGLF